MQITKYTQGISTWNFRREIDEMLSDSSYTSFIIAVAFATENGIDLLEESIKEVGSNLTVYVGVRNGVTTYQAIMKLLQFNTKVWAIDTGTAAKIYHEKTYVASNDKNAVVLTGSGNLTRGGLISNIESGTKIVCDYSNQSSWEYFLSVDYQLDTLRKKFPQNVYLIEDEVMAGELLQSGILIDERKKVSRIVKGTAKASQTSIEVPPMKTYVEALPKNKKKKEKISADTYVISIPEEDQNEFNSIKYKELWKSKELTERDLNIPSNAGTNTTGSMLLKKGAYDIDQQSYFYDRAFSDLTWKIGDGTKSKFLYTSAHFDFLIDGVFMKGYELVLKHDPRTNTRTYLQKQPMTHLMWGPAKSLVAKRHLLGEIMTLYKDTEHNGRYLIKIDLED